MGGCTASTVDQYNPETRMRHNSVLSDEDLSCTEAVNPRRSTLVQQGITVRKNSITGMLEGMPK